MFFPLMAFAIVVAMRLDILMISSFIGEEQSGIYSAASRLINHNFVIWYSFFSIYISKFE